VKVKVQNNYVRKSENIGSTKRKHSAKVDKNKVSTERGDKKRGRKCEKKKKVWKQ
jgi:hypothetical protein